MVLMVRMFLACSLVLLPQFTRIEAAILYAIPCTLQWDTCQNTCAAGYALYFGQTGSTTTNRVDVGMTNQITLNNLLASSNYFFYVVAYDSVGVESPPSNVIHYSPPTLSPLRVTPLPNGALNLLFQTAPGAACHVEYTPSLNPANWQLLNNTTADTNGNVTIIDPRSGNPPTRFYRAVVP